MTAPGRPTVAEPALAASRIAASTIAQPPFTAPVFAAPDIVTERRADGSVLLRSRTELAPYGPTVLSLFQASVARAPDRTMVAERSGAGWRTVSYASAGAQVGALARALLKRDRPGRPAMVLSGNSVDHLLFTLAAQAVGIPVVPVSVAHSRLDPRHTRLRAMTELVRPAVVLAPGDGFGAALTAIAEASGSALEQIIVDRTVPESGAPGLGATGRVRTTAFDELLATPSPLALDELAATIGPDDVAKYLFTSGSTGVAKAVITTHRMLCANQQMMRQVWPFLAEQPPVVLDWLPWSHTFGGSHNVNLVLAHAGSLFIDDGRPTGGQFDRTVENLAELSPTLVFNVPLGMARLAARLEADPEAARRFFRDLRVLFCAAAALPQELWVRLRRLADTCADHPVELTTSWGATETAPAATSAHFRSPRADCIGVPLPGVELKLVPVHERLEIRVKGPTVTPGYFGRPELTAAAFDDEGYYRTGDAVELLDPSRPGAGLRFAGRIAEDFKLSSGTWVAVAAVREALLRATGGLLADCVIAGSDRDFVTALAWPDAASCGAFLGAGLSPEQLVADPALAAELRARLVELNRGAGSARRVRRIALLAEPPRLDVGEITDKGSLNQAACLRQRADLVSALYSAEPPPGVSDD